MANLDRRSFLAFISCSPAEATVPAKFVKTGSPRNSTSACRLELAAPFIVADTKFGVECGIVLTSDTFAGTADEVSCQPLNLRLTDERATVLMTVM